MPRRFLLAVAAALFVTTTTFAKPPTTSASSSFDDLKILELVSGVRLTFPAVFPLTVPLTMDSFPIVTKTAESYPDVIFPPGIATDSPLVSALYPESYALNAVLRQHHASSYDGKSFLVIATEFASGNPEYPEHYVVYANREASRIEEVYSQGRRGGAYGEISRDTFAAIRRLVATPPPSDPPKELNDLLLVTYASGTQRITRLYDKRNLPFSVQQITAIKPEVTLPEGALNSYFHLPQP